MDKDELQKNIAIYFAKLPPMAQDFFSRMEWLKTVQGIGTKFGLDDKQQEYLTTETILALLAIIHPVEYSENLERSLGVAQSVCEKINTEIEKSILKSIKQQLIETFNAHKKAEAEQAKRDEAPTEEVYSTQIDSKLDARFDKLPAELKSVLEKSNFQSALYNLSQKYKLSVEQMGALDNATTNLIIGAIEPNEFRDALEAKVGLDVENADSLAEEVANKVFKKIREILVAESTPKDKGLEEPSEDVIIPETIIKKDENVLKSHGIEILQEEKPQPVETSPSKMLEGKEEPLEIPAPAPVPKITPVMNLHPLLNQKLSGSVQTVVTKNQYGINNAPIKAEGTSVTSNASPKSSGYKQGEDPYRIKPGE